MLFTRFFSLLFLCTIFGFASAASVAPARKRFGTEAEAVSILQDLATEINGLLPQFAALQQAGNATDDDVIPLVNQLTGALGSAGTQLLNLANPFFVPRNIQDDSIDRRQSEFTTLWNEIVSVVEAIVTALESLFTVQNLETLLQLIAQGVALATSIINLVTGIIGL